MEIPKNLSKKDKLAYIIRNETFTWLRLLHDRGCDDVRNVPICQVDKLADWAASEILNHPDLTT
jgi:hypothetical protein